jgi:hypothetical protein
MTQAAAGQRRNGEQTQPERPWPPYPRRRIFADRYMIALGVLFVALSVVAVVTTVWAMQPREAPVDIELSPSTSWEDLCPGQRIEQQLDMTLEAPAVYQIDVSFEDAEGAGVIFGRVGDGRIAQARPGLPYPVSMTRDISWRVPILPPGIYYRSVGVTTEGLSAEPIIISQEFRIGEDCPTADLYREWEQILGPEPTRLCCPYPTRAPTPLGGFDWLSPKLPATPTPPAGQAWPVLEDTP